MSAYVHEDVRIREMAGGWNVQDPNSELRERVAQAERAAAEAQARADKASAKAAKAERKARGGVFKRLSRKVQTTVVGIAVAIIAVAVICTPLLVSKLQPASVVTVSKLQDLVSASKLSTADFAYNGIAEIKDAEGNVRYHAYYEAHAAASVDMTRIDFEVDDDAKAIRPVLPEPSVEEPVIDDRSIRYFEKNASVSIRDVVGACKEDARAEIGASPQVKQTASDNLKAVVEALIAPLADKAGYTVEWPEPDPSIAAAVDAAAQDAARGSEEVSHE